MKRHPWPPPFALSGHADVSTFIPAELLGRFAASDSQFTGHLYNGCSTQNLFLRRITWKLPIAYLGTCPSFRGTKVTCPKTDAEVTLRTITVVH